MKCSVETCPKEATKIGMCASHARRMKLYGDPTVVKQQQYHGLTIPERFFRYVKKGSKCWLWVGLIGPGGYGRMTIGGYPKIASRISWEIHNGGIPEGKCVLHKCDNPQCVNPEHLFLGTQAKNLEDMRKKGRDRQGHMVGETHGMAKLTDDDIREIRKSGESTVSLAKKYGVSQSTLHAAKSGKTWKHVI